MRKVVGVLLSVMLVLSVSGCDFFRVLAGRPTSSQIEAKRALIEREYAEHQAHMDSLKQIERSLEDSLSSSMAKAMAASEDIRHSKDSLSLGCRYHIIIGTFSNRSNAEKIAERAAEAGYTPELIRYSNGFTAVSVFGGDDLVEVVRILERVRGESFCPKDAWILESD